MNSFRWQETKRQVRSSKHKYATHRHCDVEVEGADVESILFLCVTMPTRLLLFLCLTGHVFAREPPGKNISNTKCNYSWIVILIITVFYVFLDVSEQLLDLLKGSWHNQHLTNIMWSCFSGFNFISSMIMII